MRIAEVIGTVTLSRCHPTLESNRWIIGLPLSADDLRYNRRPKSDTVVILDQLGAGNGQRIGISEGAEAAVPFYPEKKPVGAYCACLLDNVAISDQQSTISDQTI